jgi:cell shape-determining protein MreC
MNLYANIRKFVNPSQSKLRQANQSLNKHLEVQQALLKNHTQTIQHAEQTIFEFKRTTEEMTKDRMELLKIIERLKEDHEVREAEMRRMTVYGFHLFDEHHPIHAIVGTKGARVSNHAPEDQAR